jgi:toxin ParE1/3/4
VKWSIKLAASARRDIAQALEWTLERFGRKKHDQYLTLIGKALSEMAVDPKNPRSKERPELHTDARSWHIGRKGNRARHFFLYRVNADRSVDVARFLHDAMDLSRHLPDGFGTSPGEE